MIYIKPIGTKIIIHKSGNTYKLRKKSNKEIGIIDKLVCDYYTNSEKIIDREIISALSDGTHYYTYIPELKDLSTVLKMNDKHKDMVINKDERIFRILGLNKYCYSIIYKGDGDQYEFSIKRPFRQSKVYTNELSKVISDIEILKLKNFLVPTNDKELNFISLINYIFRNHAIYHEMSEDIGYPEWMKINYQDKVEYLTDTITSLFEENPTRYDYYVMFLNEFRRRKPNNLLDQSLKTRFNLIIEIIGSKIEEKLSH